MSLDCNEAYYRTLFTFHTCDIKAAQWLSGRVLDSRPRAVGSSPTGVTALCFLSKTHLS